MSKVSHATVGQGYGAEGWLIRCPACNREHFIPKDGRWTFNGNIEKPTFKPSINECSNPPNHKNYRPDIPTFRCHYIITDGRIAFCSDCTHALKGQTVELPDVVIRD